jgi:aryl-alcohol dehydrogenase-like predicted oxidoreductase
MTFGTKQQDRYGECNKEAVFEIMDHFYSKGGNFLDTANVYQYGESEEWIGERMTSRQDRDQLVLATKIQATTWATRRTTSIPTLGATDQKA